MYEITRQQIVILNMIWSIYGTKFNIFNRILKLYITI